MSHFLPQKGELINGLWVKRDTVRCHQTVYSRTGIILGQPLMLRRGINSMKCLCSSFKHGCLIFINTYILLCMVKSFLNPNSFNPIFTQCKVFPRPLIWFRIPYRISYLKKRILLIFYFIYFWMVCRVSFPFLLSLLFHNLFFLSTLRIGPYTRD